MRVLLFTKYPAPGLVKTRLAAEIGFESAAGLQDAFVRDELDMLQGMGADATLYCDPLRPLEDYRERFGPARACRAQRGADLGARMLAALNENLADGCRAAVLIGSDLPDLPAGQILAALAALEAAPVCLGPSPDGGFHLLGAGAPLPDALFTGVEWGGPQVLARTLANCAGLGLEPALLPSWPDVDTLTDLQDYARRNRGRQTRTMRRILELGLSEGPWTN